MRLNLNLARRERKPVFLPLLVYGLFLVALVLSLWYQYRFFYLSKKAAQNAKAQELARVKSDLASLDKPDLDPARFAAAVQAVNARVESFNELVAGKNFRWSAFLSVLETTLPDNVSVESIRFSLRELSGVLEGKSEKFSHVLKFVKRLQGVEILRDVFLIHHARETIGEDDSPEGEDTRTDIFQYRICFTFLGGGRQP